MGAVMMHIRVRKGDLVRVISGKEKGKEGKVLRVFPEKEVVVVERLNIYKKHAKPSQKNPRGGVLELEGKIHVSNVMVVCGHCNQPTRLGAKILSDGKKLRVCRRCGEVLDHEKR